jgi:hypothetical protein
MSAPKSAAKSADWEKTEERFASLVRLGGDERTPDHERSNACKAAVSMFTRGDMTVVSTGRWQSLMVLYRSMLTQVRPLTMRCTSENVQGRNGWRCCQCGAVQMNLWIWVFRRVHCALCGHERCDGPSPGGEPE